MKTLLDSSAAIAVMLPLCMLSINHAIAYSGADPEEVIRESSERVLDTVRQYTEISDDSVTSSMAEELLEALEPVVDFDSIALGVMGEHAQEASDSQVERFASIFKSSLSKLYIKSFESLDVQSIEVMPLPDDFEPETTSRVSVEMRADTGGGESFDLRYSMRKNEAGDWVVRNIIVDDVNLGLTYMNQFDGAVKRHGSIEKAIESWPEEMEDEAFEASGDDA